MRIFLWPLAIVLMLAGAASAGQKPPPFPVGTWYGEGQPSYKTVMWVPHYYANGTVTARFRFCTPQGPFDSSLSGTWRYKDGKLTITSEGGRIDTYQTVSLDKQRWRYRYLASTGQTNGIGFVFTAVRVTDDSEIPPCEFTS